METISKFYKLLFLKYLHNKLLVSNRHINTFLSDQRQCFFIHENIMHPNVDLNFKNLLFCSPWSALLPARVIDIMIKRLVSATAVIVIFVLMVVEDLLSTNMTNILNLR